MASQVCIASYSFLFLIIVVLYYIIITLFINPYRTLLQESALQSEVLMTQLELPGSTVYTLEDWLKQHTEKRLKTTIVNFFEQVNIHCTDSYPMTVFPVWMQSVV